jgi:hypothetical protein
MDQENLHQSDNNITLQSQANSSKEKKKDKKLVFLSRSVLSCVRKNHMTTGTVIANEILELYKRFSERVDFKNV